MPKFRTWESLSSSLISLTQQEMLSPQLLLAIQILFQSDDPNYINIQLKNIEYLINTQYFSIVQVLEAKEQLAQHLLYYTTDLYYNIIESLLWLIEKQQLSSINYSRYKQDSLSYINLIKGNSISPIKNNNQFQKQKQQIRDYSQERLKREKKRIYSYKDTKINQDFLENNTLTIDHYKIKKSTDISNINLNELPKSNLHNYYVKKILNNDSNQQQYKLQILDNQKQIMYNETFNNKEECFTLIGELTNSFKIKQNMIYQNGNQISFQLSNQQIQEFQSTPKLNQSSIKAKRICYKLQDHIMCKTKLTFQ